MQRLILLLVVIAGCSADDDGTGNESAGEGDSTALSVGDSTGDVSSTAGTASAGSTGGGSGSTGDPCDCSVGAYAPRCGVDGMTYDAACGIECVPVEIACTGECPCPEFICGEMPCTAAEVVCTAVVGGAKGSGTSYSCGTLPPACMGVLDPDCATCFASVGCDCVEEPADHFQITCYAP